MIILLLYLLNTIATIYAENTELRMVQYGSKILLMPLLAIYLYSKVKNFSTYKLIYVALFFSWRAWNSSILSRLYWFGRSHAADRWPLWNTSSD